MLAPLLFLLWLFAQQPVKPNPSTKPRRSQTVTRVPDQELRDRSNRLLGRIRQRPDGKLELRDVSNRLRGTYEPRSNETHDASNRLMGRGNLLTSLL